MIVITSSTSARWPASNFKPVRLCKARKDCGQPMSLYDCHTGMLNANVAAYSAIDSAKCRSPHADDHQEQHAGDAANTQGIHVRVTAVAEVTSPGRPAADRTTPQVEQLIVAFRQEYTNSSQTPIITHKRFKVSLSEVPDTYQQSVQWLRCTAASLSPRKRPVHPASCICSINDLMAFRNQPFSILHPCWQLQLPRIHRCPLLLTHWLVWPLLLPYSVPCQAT